MVNFANNFNNIMVLTELPGTCLTGENRFLNISVHSSTKCNISSLDNVHSSTKCNISSLDKALLNIYNNIMVMNILIFAE